MIWIDEEFDDEREVDVWKLIDRASQEYDKKTGLTELIYGEAKSEC